MQLGALCRAVSGMSIVGAISTVDTARSTARATPILNARDIVKVDRSKDLSARTERF